MNVSDQIAIELQVLSFVVTLAALLISCFRTATSYGIFISGSTDAVELFNMNDLDNDLRRPVTTLIFHTLFTCASCFMLMVCLHTIFISLDWN